MGPSDGAGDGGVEGSADGGREKVGAADGAYVVPDGDLAAFLEGGWRRSLEGVRFGGDYDALSPTNSFALIEDDPDAAPEPNSR